MAQLPAVTYPRMVKPTLALVVVFAVLYLALRREIRRRVALAV